MIVRFVGWVTGSLFRTIVLFFFVNTIFTVSLHVMMFDVALKLFPPKYHAAPVQNGCK